MTTPPWSTSRSRPDGDHRVRLRGGPAATYGSAVSAYPPPPSDPWAARFGPDQYHYQARGVDKSQATWALLLSLVPCCIGQLISLVLAIITLTKNDARVDYGKGRAVAALIISGVWTIVLVSIGVVQGINDEINREDDPFAGSPVVAPTPSEPGSTLVNQLEVGDCLRDRATMGRIVELVVVPCRQPHHGEVYADFELLPVEFPGEKQVVRLARRGCLQQQPDLSLTESRGLDVFYIYPQNSFDYALEKSVTCVAESRAPRRGRLDP